MILRFLVSERDCSPDCAAALTAEGEMAIGIVVRMIFVRFLGGYVV